MNYIINKILDFIFPKRCIICDDVLPFGSGLTNEFICENCKDKIEFIKEPTCKKCGAAIDDFEELLCVRCKKNYEKHESSYEYGFGLCRYNEYVKESMHHIKYSNRKEYLEFYGRLIARVYKDRFLEMGVDCFLPVPIHKKRFKERNYNQAEVLAKYISDELKKNNVNIAVRNDLMYRYKNTKVLNKLMESERKNELKNSFIVNEEKLCDIKSICIVDDIYTTGSTIETISNLLKKSGISKIYFVCICIVDNL